MALRVFPLWESELASYYWIKHQLNFFYRYNALQSLFWIIKDVFMNTGAKGGDGSNWMKMWVKLALLIAIKVLISISIFHCFVKNDLSAIMESQSLTRRFPESGQEKRLDSQVPFFKKQKNKKTDSNLEKALWSDLLENIILEYMCLLSNLCQ